MNVSEAHVLQEEEKTAPVDGRNDLAEEIAEMLNIPDAKMVILGAMADYDVTKKQTALTVYDGGQTEYLIKRFLVAKKLKGCTDQTCRLYRSNLRRSFAQIGKSPTQCDQTDIQRVLASLILKKCSKSYQQNIHRTFSSFYTWLTREELVAKNIMNKVDPIQAKARHKKAFTEIEVEKIRMACETNREKCLIEVLLSTACRIFEVASLRVDQVRENNEISIIGKGEKERAVFLNAKARLSVDAYLKERKDKNPYLFPASVLVKQYAENGKCNPSDIKGGNRWYCYPENVSENSMMDKSTLEAIIRRIGRRSGVEQCHPHRFRRTSATMALRRGMNVVQVQKMLGHESLATTQRYLDISEEEVRDAHRRFMT